MTEVLPKLILGSIAPQQAAAQTAPLFDQGCCPWRSQQSPAHARRPPSRHRGSGRWLGVMLALPAVVLLSVFLLWPVLVSVDYSTTSATGFGDKSGVGLANYSHVLHDQRFRDSLVRNVSLAAMVVSV